MKFIANIRKSQGSKFSRRLRLLGEVPAIIYEKNKNSTLIQLKHKDIFYFLIKKNLNFSILNIEFGDKYSEKVLIKSIQWHAYKNQILHVDFQKLYSNKKINTKIPLRFFNEKYSPAVKLNSATINYIIKEIEISCKPIHLPEFIAIDLKKIDIGKYIYLDDVFLPYGVKYKYKNNIKNPLLATAILNKDKSEENNVNNIENKNNK